MASEAASSPRVLVIAGATGLLVGGIDLAIGLWTSAASPSSLGALAPCGSVATLATAAAYLLVWFALFRPLGRAAELRAGPLALALGAGVLGTYAGFLLLGSFAGASLALTLPLGLVAATAVYVVLARGAPPTERRAGRLLGSAVALAFGALVLSPLAIRSRTASTRPITDGHDVERVILIVVDTLRADALSCYSSSPGGSTTPSIDRLAAGSLLFTGARSPAPWTLPSVCSIMTGASPLVHRAVEAGSILPASLPTLAERMAQAGYRTGAIGRATFLLPRSRLDRGFDDYHWYPRIVPESPLGGAIVRSLWPVEEVDAASLTEMASAWIEDHADEDFFLWLHYFDVHLPYAPPFAYRPDTTPPAGMDWAFANLSEVRFGRRSPSLEQRRWIRELYQAEARYFDDQLAALVATLERLGLYDDTLIVLTSDHGEEFWEHEGFEHGHTLYDEVLAVPLIVKLPGRSEGGRVDGPVSTESVAPTILSVCGLSSEAGELLGSSLVHPDGTPVDGTAEWLFVGSAPLYYQDRIAVLQDGLKYVRWLETGDEELYDLVTDPGEKTSIAATAPDRLAQARRRCDEVLESAERQRARFGTLESASEALDDEHRAELRRLGYVE